MKWRERILGPLRVLDLIVAALVIVIIVGLGAAWRSTKASSTEPQDVAWKMRALVEEVNAPVASSILRGQQVRLDLRADSIGSVTGVSSRGTPTDVPNAQGRLVPRESSITKDVTITIEGTGVFDGVNLEAGGKALKLNDQLDLYSETWHLRGIVVELTWTPRSGR